MVWVFGNSHERVSIKDLDDVIYYHQKKQYTDQEFQRSRDLQREIQSGRIIKLDSKPEVKSSLPNDLSSPVSVGVSNPPINLHEIKNIVSEALAENKNEEPDFKKLLTNLIPMIAETVRQEISKITVTQQVVRESVQKQSEIIGPSYVPTIKTDNMKSNINTEERKISGNDVSGSLEALKRLKDLNKT